MDFDHVNEYPPVSFRQTAHRRGQYRLVLEDADDAAARAHSERSRALRIGLLQAGYNIVAALPGDFYLQERIAQLQLDIIIIDAESDARDVLEQIVTATRDAPRPIALILPKMPANHI